VIIHHSLLSHFVSLCSVYLAGSVCSGEYIHFSLSKELAVHVKPNFKQWESSFYHDTLCTMKMGGVISSCENEIRMHSALTTILRCRHCLQHPEGTWWNCSTCVFPGLWHLLFRRWNIWLGCCIPWNNVIMNLNSLFTQVNFVWSCKQNKTDVVLNQ